MDSLIAVLEPYFTTKSPLQIPANGREAIARYSWAISLALGLVAAISVLGVIGSLGWVGSLAAVTGQRVSWLYWLAAAALVVQMVLLFAAVPGLKERTYEKGWKIVFFNVLFGFVGGVLLHLGLGGIIRASISLIVGLFLLYQMKSYFH